MDDIQSSDDIAFIPENVESLVLDTIESVLKDKAFNDSLVSTWIDEICSKLSKELIESNKPFKYVISCAIMQKNGAGVHLGHSCHWDAVNDNTVVTRWPSEKKKDPNAKVICMCTVFGLSY